MSITQERINEIALVAAEAHDNFTDQDYLIVPRSEIVDMFNLFYSVVREESKE